PPPARRGAAKSRRPRGRLLTGRSAVPVNLRAIAYEPRTPPPPPAAVPLPHFAGEDPRSLTAAPLDLPPFTGEGDHAKRGEGGVSMKKLGSEGFDREHSQPLRHSHHTRRKPVGGP